MPLFFPHHLLISHNHYDISYLAHGSFQAWERGQGRAACLEVCICTISSLHAHFLIAPSSESTNHPCVDKVTVFIQMKPFSVFEHSSKFQGN